MAKRVVTLLIDDLDGESEAVETVVFAVDGAQFEIDLTAEHAQALRETAAEFSRAARQVTPRSATSTRRPRASTT